jgi:hypothetical protein
MQPPARGPRDRDAQRSDRGLHLAPREPEQGQPGLRLEPELVRALERRLGAGEVAEAPAHVASYSASPASAELKLSSSSDALAASASACGQSPRRPASCARLRRHMPGNGDSGGIDSAHARAASPQSPARRTSASSRHAPMTLQKMAPVKKSLSSPATTEVIASSRRATPSETCPCSIRIRPWVWIAIPRSSRSPKRWAISVARSASGSAISGSPLNSRTVPSRSAAKPSSTQSGRLFACLWVRANHPAPTAGSSRRKCSMHSRADIHPARRSLPASA